LPPINSTGSYSDEEYDKVRGLIALVHAEVEAYIETRCLEVAQGSFSLWLTTRSPNSVIFAIYTMCYSGWAALGDKIEGLPKISNENDLEKRIGSAVNQYEHVVNDNNGIKEANLKKLLVPLSIRIKIDLDAPWVLAMSDFGGDRGKVVHMTWKANNPPDPGDFKKLLRGTLLPGLKKLDAHMTALVANAAAAVPSVGFKERLVRCLKMLFYGQ
jgi:hypothetical protein